MNRTARVAPEEAAFRPALPLRPFAGALPEKQMATYSEKLRDPRWQKMRLEILQRDDWACQICFDTKSTLNVHHRYYEAGRDPWNYPEPALVTLCEDCHALEGDYRAESETRLIKALRSAGAFNSQIDELAEMFELKHFSEHEWSILTCHLWNLFMDHVGDGGRWTQIREEAGLEWARKAAEKKSK